MDAQNRGRAEKIDPADQWVLNPATGDYELRLDQSVGQSPASPPRGAAPRRNTRARTAAPQRQVPGQRSRRAANGSAGGPGGSPPQAGRRKRKQPKARKKKALLWTGGVLAFVLVGGSVGGYLAYQHFNGNLTSIDIAGAGSGGFKKDEAVNVLVIGTDKRTGAGNEGYGDKNSTGHADTTILFHVSKDRTNATALSIPRDLKTDIPDCPTKMKDGTEKTIPGTDYVRFNESLGQFDRDPGCTMRTVKQLTGLTVDHFMMVDFNAVKTLTTAVGGVEVCVAEAVNDEKSKLKLPKGESTIEGEQALAFVRTRHAFGNESDLDRIKTQQQFLSSMLRKMKSSDTLSSPTKMWDLADAATKALTVDNGIADIEKLRDLGMELSKVEMKNITFTTLPVVDNPAEKIKATVVVDKARADPLFAMMRSDTSLTEVKQKEKAAKSKQKALLKGPKAEAADVRVSVYNGGGPSGSASETLIWLQNQMGVLKSSNEGNAPKVPKTTLKYAPNQADQARRLANMMGLPASAMKPGKEDAADLEAMTLVLGGDFKGAGVPIVGPAKAPEGIQKVEADKSVCAK
ncbi:LCP family protein [Streptomyces sp. ISL-98]|uniref:LCP family protein n=1 Tax=Streptomyces sp. ISL-98 TaxID=2819192 RepID=UPI001BE65A4D|nr:LCP family protein [Streptomyces sp. ISL-98]MBT2507600.1 LCP family protein [Streptomyces sp. ISL-98]